MKKVTVMSRRVARISELCACPSGSSVHRLRLLTAVDSLAHHLIEHSQGVVLVAWLPTLAIGVL